MKWNEYLDIGIFPIITSNHKIHDVLLFAQYLKILEKC